MATDDSRVFARWRRESDPAPGYWPIPADGGCLSVFLLVQDPTDPGRIALGTPDPSAPWSRIGALDEARLSRIGDRLMLPSCHLVEYESPDAAARRVEDEQLGRTDLVLSGPQVVSDAYGRPDATGQHWDLHFLYRTTWPRGVPLAAPAWKRLTFEDPRSLPRERYARAHDDIVRFAGFETPR
ncbi:MAG: hypothetical protein L3K00_05865 [Thermoplasmata archaeon]|nr:hypothetical protein [Thermoplasmata archaeon]